MMGLAMKDSFNLLISEDFLEGGRMKILAKTTNGHQTFYILMRILGLAAKSNASGFLLIDRNIPYNIELLSMFIGEEEEDVRLAIETLIKLKFLTQTEEGYTVENFIDFLGFDDTKREQAKLRMQKYREEKKQLPAPAGVEKEVAATVEKSKKKKEKRIYESGSIELEMAEYLFEKMLHNNPDAKKPNFQSWADDVRKMIEIDKRTAEQVKFIIDWCQQDVFWSTNILSCKKLREKFDQLTVRVKSEFIGNQNKPSVQKEQARLSAREDVLRRKQNENRTIVSDTRQSGVLLSEFHDSRKI